EHRGRVPVDLHLPPFLPEHALGVDQKGAALDAEHAPPAHVLLADHVEQLPEPLVRAGDQLEREALLGLELLVRGEAVPRDAEHADAEALEGPVEIAEALALERAARRRVLRIEIEHVRRASKLL